MKNRAKEILSTRMPQALKEHIKKVAKPNVNAWVIEKLAKASKWK